MKEMGFDFKSNKSKPVFVKFAVCFLMLGLAFRLFYPSFIDFSPETSEALLVIAEEASPPLAELPAVSGDVLENDNIQVNETQASKNVTGECDMFTGQWVRDPSSPFYTNESCHDIEAHQNCMKNGRPDSDFLYWRWKPRDCDLPKFDPWRFLDLMRNKSWAFIGDSISRNHVQSLLCILSQVEQAVEVYHDKEYRSKRWHFPSHNFTLSVIWTPFLLKAAIFEDINGVSSADVQLHLDKLDALWTDQYENLDYVVIAGGKWFLKTAIYYENNTVQGCHSCSGKNLTEIGFDYAYRKALGLIFNFFTTSSHKAYVFFRTTTPDHFENGEWFSGGYCNRTGPFEEGRINLRMWIG
ncbi:hypothetical protein NMG60_11022763 [Bertholletia excelsa]